MTIENSRKSAIRGAGFTLERAAELLKMSRTTLYSQLAKEELSEEFEQNVKKVLKVDLTKIRRKEVIPLGKRAHTRHAPDAFEDWEGLPMYNAPVTASFVESYRDEATYQPQYYLHDPRFRDCNFGAIITGDSMHSEIRHGDFVVCQEIVDKCFIVFGDIYYVVATNGLETCKYLNADPSDPENFLLIARNEKISPSPIPKSKVLRLFKVKGIVRGY